MRRPTPPIGAQLNLLARVRSDVSIQLSLSARAQESREPVARLAQLLIEAAKSTADQSEESCDD